MLLSVLCFCFLTVDPHIQTCVYSFPDCSSVVLTHERIEDSEDFTENEAIELRREFQHEVETQTNLLDP